MFMHMSDVVIMALQMHVASFHTSCGIEQGSKYSQVSNFHLIYISETAQKPKTNTKNVPLEICDELFFINSVLA